MARRLPGASRAARRVKDMDPGAGWRMQLALGGFVFDLHAETRPLLPPLGHGYAAFLGEARDDCGAAAGERIRVRVAPADAWAPTGRLLFETGSRWALWEQGDERELVFYEMHAGAPEPSIVLRFRPAGRAALLHYLPAWLAGTGAGGAVRSPFHYPADQLLTMYLLGARGLMLHAAALDVGGAAVACLGVSGAGKTTFTRLAASALGWEPVTDERVIVRLDDPDGARLYGTPWHGEGEWAANRALPVRALVFLDRGAVNEASLLSPSAGLPRLLRTVSLPWFDPRPLEAGLSACEEALRRLPCVRLVFRREPQAAGVLARFLDEHVAAPLGPTR